MSYNRQPVAEDPMQIWGAVGVLLILLLFVIWLFLPEVVYASCLILHTLWGLVDWGPFHNYAAPRYNLLAMTGNNAANISFGTVNDDDFSVITVISSTSRKWSWTLKN